MKARKSEILTTALFCGFLAAMLVLFLILPREDFSQLEKRNLKDAPGFSWQALVSGDLGEEIESYMADHIPGRSFFVGLNAYFEKWTGRQSGKDIWTAGDHRLVEAPVQWDEARIRKNMSVVNGFADKLGQTVDFMLVPSAGWALGEHPELYQDESYVNSIYTLAGENLTPIDLLETYRGRGDLYFKTDHHWTSRGAYEGYRVCCQAAGREPQPEEAFAIRQRGDFRGSTYSRSALWLTPAEPQELWEREAGITVTNGESQETHQGVFYWERLEEPDKYTVNLDGNHSIVRTHNPEGQGRLLVIRDSYANSLGTFLAQTWEDVVLVDLRYYKNPVSELLEGENFDNVLICYSIGNFMTDANLIWLR